MTGRLVGLVGAMLLLAYASSAQVYQTACADCHIVDRRAPAPEHVVEWSLSPHGRHQVGCDKCHGGDPSASNAADAHRGLLTITNAASPVYFRNLPATCGTCHPGPFTAFQRSRHYELLLSSNRQAPVCSTCHGTVGARLPSPTQVELQCTLCHGEKARARDAEYTETTRRLYESLHEYRERLRFWGSLISDVRDKKQRAQLTKSQAEVESLFRQAVAAGHAFDADELRANVSAARERSDALTARIEALRRR
jgi:hypothetical protein